MGEPENWRNWSTEEVRSWLKTLQLEDLDKVMIRKIKIKIKTNKIINKATPKKSKNKI